MPVGMILVCVMLFTMLSQLYAWGCGSCLGCGSSEATALRPRLIEDLQKVRVVDISCGDSHCLALSHGQSHLTGQIYDPLTSFMCPSSSPTICLVRIICFPFIVYKHVSTASTSKHAIYEYLHTHAHIHLLNVTFHIINEKSNVTC